MLALTPNPKMQFFDSDGNFLAGGKVYTYEAGTSTPLATYTDSTGAQENTNPIILSAKGQASIWLSANAYKFVVYDANDVLQPDGGDNLDPLGFTTSEWVDTADTPTFIDSTSFSVPNDRTLSYEPFRAIKATVSAGTVYGHILSSVFSGGITTVTVRLKSGAIDSGISATSLSLITATNTSNPFSSLILSEDTDTIAAATDTDILGSQSSTIELTGASPITITAFGTSLREGLKHRVTSTGAGAHVLTHNATSLILPGGQNIFVEQGDSFWVEDLGSNNARVYGYTRASGESLYHVPGNHIDGLTLANNVTDSEHDIDISTGTCEDVTSGVYLKLSSALTKQIDAAWAAGTNQGGLFSGTVAADTFYAVHLIMKDSDGSIDAGFDTSDTAANIPAGYTAYRRIGWVLTDGSSNIIAFSDEEIAGGSVIRRYLADIVERSGSLALTTRQTISVAVPKEQLGVFRIYATYSAATARAWANATDYVDVTPSSPTLDVIVTSGVTNISVNKEIYVDSSNEIAYRASATFGNFDIMTIGFIDRRV